MLSFNQENRTSSANSSEGSMPAEPDYYDGSLTVSELVDGVASPSQHTFKPSGVDYRAPQNTNPTVEQVDYRVPSAMQDASVSAFGAVDTTDGGAAAGADYRCPLPVQRRESAVLNPEPTYITAESLAAQDVDVDEAVYYQATLAEDEVLQPQKPRFAMKWDYKQLSTQQYLNPATAPNHTACNWYHGNITRDEAEVRLLRARASRSSSDTSNMFLVREKVAGVTYAVSVLSPMPGFETRSLSAQTPEMNEITHHLVARAKRTDGTLGSHYLVNSVHRLRDCKTLFAVLCELSKPGLPAFALAEKKLPGLPLTECATRQKDVQVFAASSYKERPRKASGVNGISAPTPRFQQKQGSALRANHTKMAASVSG